MTDTLREALEKIQREGEERSMKFAAAQLRKFLATALCVQCGEPLGVGEVCQDDDAEATVHAACLQAYEDGK